MLGHLVEGMRQAGAAVELVHLRQKNIKQCIGCFTCMTRSPGRCMHNDDMSAELFPKWLASDMAVYATPLFHHTVNAPMKTFLERTFPICEPFVERDGRGRWVHPLRQEPPAHVILSVCGFLDESAFQGLSQYVNFLFHGERLAAEIYRSGSEMLTYRKDKLADVLDATEQAGRELVQSMSVSPQTMARIAQPLDDAESLADVTNAFWRTCIEEGVTPRAFEKRGLVPRPGSIEGYMRIMRVGFDAEGAAGVEAVLEFRFSGEAQGWCHFMIRDGTIETGMGGVEKADLTIEAPFELWMDVVTGKKDGAQMLMEGRYRAEGDLSLMRLFG